METGALAGGVQEAKDLAALGWLLVSAALVFFMQAGFACIESGAVRWKNSVNVALKNVIDLCCSFPAFFVVGFSLMFGASIGGVIGTPAAFLSGVDTASILSNPGTLAFFLFQATFCSTAATIVSGGVAERCRFMPYLLVSLGVGIVVYPVFGHWVWGGGWLAALGYHDFAGSSVVHMIGGGVALAGIVALGPRLGRFAPDGTPRRIPASSMPLVAIGCCLLAFCWVGFNGGSAPLGPKTALIIVNTLNAACFGGLAALLLSWAFGGLAAVDVILNGFLGGLVAVTACCDIIPLPASALVGLVGGAVVVLGSWLLERWRLDDAVGAVPVHLMAGAAGIILTGVFADPAWLQERQMSRAALIGVQALGAATCLAWSFGVGALLWWVVGRITTPRVGEAEEQIGMNFSEHKVDDPVADLTAAVSAAAAGRERALSLDDVRDGDLVPLARAVTALLERRRAGVADRARWAELATELRQRLAEHGAEGGRDLGAASGEATEAVRSLDHVLAFLDQQRGGPAFVPVLRDLVAGLQERLTALAERLPRQDQRWRSVRETADRLDELAGALRTAR